VELAATHRFISSVQIETLSSNPLLTGGTAATDRKLGARSYFDLAAVWTIDKTFTLRGGVNNIFDRDPPIVDSTIADPAIFGNGNTFPQIYDTLGRLVFMNLTAKF
jgi:outer membrane receptor protein involved in Fe transport